MNHSQRLYYTDPHTLEFEAEARQQMVLPDGRLGVILDRSYFYPTSGGQEHDTGWLGAARVIDVFKDPADELHGPTIHVIDRELAPGRLLARIDAPRRLAHMQHHTAQHLLTQCFVRAAGLDTLSANINGNSPSTLDLNGEPSNTQVEQAESLANQTVYTDLPVKTYFVGPEELARLPLRKPPAVSEDIRIIEIDGYDYSACGGTHVAHTGSIGLIKVTRLERLKDKTRVHFVAGEQARDLFRACFDSVTTLAAQMSLHPADLSAAVERQGEQLRAAQKELQLLRLKLIPLEAQELGAAAVEIDGQRQVRAKFEGRPAGDLRLLAAEFKSMPGVTALLASYEGGKLSLAAACGPGSRHNAQELLRAALAPFNGRGGGDASLAQGGGPATPDQWRQFLNEPI